MIYLFLFLLGWNAQGEMGYNKRFSTPGVWIIWKPWSPKKLMHIFCDPAYLYQPLWKHYTGLEGKREKVCEIGLEVVSGDEECARSSLFTSLCSCSGLDIASQRGALKDFGRVTAREMEKSMLIPTHLYSINKLQFAFVKNRHLSLDLWGTGKCHCFVLFCFILFCFSEPLFVKKYEHRTDLKLGRFFYLFFSSEE